MQRQNRKSRSIMRKFLVPMIIVMLIQSVLFASSVFIGGTINKLNNNSFDILNEKVRGRKNYLENEMLQRWSNLSEIEDMINTKVNGYRNSNPLQTETADISTLDAINTLNLVAEDLIYMLRKNSVTGAFLILDGGNKGDTVDCNQDLYKTGLYFRDLDPVSNPDDMSDLLIERGSASISKRLNIPLDTRWASQFCFKGNHSQESNDYFNKPFQAALQYPYIESKDLGYWSRPFRLSNDDVEIITYSIPLRDDEGVPYGVLGVEVSLDYLRKQLPYDEIIEKKKGSYLLGISQGGEDDFAVEPVMTSGPIIRNLLGDSKVHQLNSEEYYSHIYEIETDSSQSNTIFSSVHFLNLYNSNTPFESEEWILAGIVGERDLLGFAQTVVYSIITGLFLAILIGVIGVFMAVKVFTIPISTLVRQVIEKDPYHLSKFDKTYIAEIDELARAIELLNYNVVESSSKLSNIISMMNAPIGAFEYYKATEFVFCTDTFFKILDIEIEMEQGGSPYIHKHDFKQVMEKISEFLEKDLVHVYRIHRRSGALSWIRLTTQEDETKILGVVVDVTHEMLDKRKIELERDHDILTGLFNRRAFHNQMYQLFENKDDLHIAALMMWDLDNLKYINDTYGHDYGDEYIKKAAQLLMMFSGERGLVARMSGDEFYVFMYNYSCKDDIRAQIDKVQRKMHSTFLHVSEQTTFKIRASAGIAWYPDDSLEFEELIKYADFAMYQVKHTVKGMIYEFDTEAYNRDAFLLHSKEELNQLIDKELVSYAFQPIVDAKTGDIFAYEALMRPELEGLRSPLDVLRLAKSQSKLNQIEYLTWFKALEAYAKYKSEIGDCKLFVNSIPNHFLSRDDLQRLESLYGSDLSKVVIEITENERIDKQSITKKEDLVSRWNSQLALDDFGAGYNGENVLLSLTPHYIKIDMSIIRGIEQDENRQKIVLNLLSYAESRGIKVIAEGVETEAELNTLIGFGVHYLQGYYTGKPSFKPQSIAYETFLRIREANQDPDD